MVQLSPLSVAVGLKVIAKVFVIPPLIAVTVAVELEATAETAAVKFAEELPALIFTEDGTATEAELLERAMVSPPVGAAVVSDTVQLSVPARE